MSFFDIKEAIEEYIEEYASQNQMPKYDFGFEVFINDDNKLIITLRYDMDWGAPKDDQDFLKELEMFNYDYDVVLSHYEEEAFNEFLEDALLPVLPKPEKRDQGSFKVFFRNFFTLCNGDKFSPDDKKIFSSAIEHPPVDVQLTRLVGLSTDPRNLTWTTSKSRVVPPDDTKHFYWNPEWEGLSGTIRDYEKDLLELIGSATPINRIASSNLCAELEHPLARIVLPDIDSHVITIDSIPQP